MGMSVCVCDSLSLFCLCVDVYNSSVCLFKEIF